jgi:tetratricopeptide (TPR) repeat protein
MPNTPHATPDAPAPQKAQSARRRWRRPLIGILLVLAAAITWGACGGGTLLLNRRASRALSFRDVAAAERWLAWSSRLGFSDGETALLKARLARRQNRMDEVPRFLTEAQRRGAAVDLLQREQWLALAQSGRMREAEPHLEKLLLDPRDDGAEICEAFVIGYLLTYRINRVEALLSAWSSDFPRDPLPHLIRARVLRSYNGWKDAEEAYRLALERDPDNAEAQHGLGDALMKQQRPGEALEWYLRVPAVSQHAVDSQLGAVDCLTALGRATEARDRLSRLRAGHPGNPRLLLADARLDLEAGNYQAAEGLLRQARALEPDNDEVLFVLASAVRGLGKTDEARQLLAESERMGGVLREVRRLQASCLQDPLNVETRMRIGKLLLSIGSQKDARIWLKSVLQINPEHQGAQEALKDSGG